MFLVLLSTWSRFFLWSSVIPVLCRFLRTVAKEPTTIGIKINLMFLNIISSLARSKYWSTFSLSLIFSLPSIFFFVCVCVFFLFVPKPFLLVTLLLLALLTLLNISRMTELLHVHNIQCRRLLKFIFLSLSLSLSLSHTHTHTHTHIYIYIYICKTSV